MATAYTENSFTRAKHSIDSTVELDESFESMGVPDGFNGELYPHQSTMLKALVDIYRQRYLNVGTNSSLRKVSNGPFVAQSNAVVISDSFGSGKTITITAFLLAIQQSIKAVPENVNYLTTPDILYRRPRDSRPVGFRTEVTRRFTRVYNPAIIIVGSAVLIQWQTALKQFSRLKIFTIGKVNSFQEFYNKVKSGEIDSYDVVLVKNGTVTKNFMLDGESVLDINGLRPIVDVVTKITAGGAWSTAIVDDFDTIKIDNNTRGVNALFTVYVSATRKIENLHRKLISYTSFTEYVRMRGTYPISQITYDSALFNAFRLRNSDKYIEDSTNIPIVQKYKYIYANPDDNYMKLLGVMGEADANTVMEMLNGDAVETAAETLGIKTNSVADIFQRMLDKKYEKFINDQQVLDCIEAAQKALPLLEDHPKDMHTVGELETIRAALIRKASPDCVKYNSNRVKSHLREMHAEFTASREANAVAVNRVKDNLKQGECQVCTLPLEDCSVVINKCCGITLCDLCCTKGCQIHKVHNYGAKTASLQGKCPNCRKTIDAGSDIIFINKDFDIKSLFTARGDEQAPEAPVKEAPPPPSPELEDIKNPKMKALLQIIRGEVPADRNESTLKIKNLIRGTRDIPQSRDTPRKVLVFAGYNESLMNIEKFLSERGIVHMRLAGTYGQMNDIVNWFRTDGTVLLVNSSHVCAGLNMQFATDLVFFHKLMDNNIEEQVCGRAQRIGRTVNLHMHYLLYNNEQAMA